MTQSPPQYHYKITMVDGVYSTARNGIELDGLVKDALSRMRAATSINALERGFVPIVEVVVDGEGWSKDE